jgi:DNA repair exonuclease SbcCD ATPase subunit
MSTPEEPLPGTEITEAEANIAPFARRSPRISRSDVFQAADELLLEGNRPTIDRVRMRLGRGSPNTINDHLDTWWAKLGSRLRDLPGHEFPQLPERVGQALLVLWNEALDGAREALQGSLAEREQVLVQRERRLEAQARELDAHEQAMAGRAAALEESLALAQEQLRAANQRATGLEGVIDEQDAEGIRQRARIETLEASAADLRRKLDEALSAHQSERAQLQAHYTATESRWMLEADRARQSTLEAAKEHERAIKELRHQMSTLQEERDHLQHGLLEARGELRTAAAVRQQLEERLRARTQEDQSLQARKFRPRNSAWQKRNR